MTQLMTDRQAHRQTDTRLDRFFPSQTTFQAGCTHQKLPPAFPSAYNCLCNYS